MRRHKSRHSSDLRPPEAQKGFAPKAHLRGLSSGHLARVPQLGTRWQRSCGPAENRLADGRVWARLGGSWSPAGRGGAHRAASDACPGLGRADPTGSGRSGAERRGGERAERP